MCRLSCIEQEHHKFWLLKKDIVLGTALVDMYVKCDMLGTARVVHKKLHCRDVVSWNALISAYVGHGQPYQALNCFQHMLSEGCLCPDHVTFVCMVERIKMCIHDIGYIL